MSDIKKNVVIIWRLSVSDCDTQCNKVVCTDYVEIKIADVKA